MKHGPLPWPGEVRVAVPEVQRVRVVEHRPSQQANTLPTYSIVADGSTSTTVLANDLAEAEAHELAREIEDAVPQLRSSQRER